MYKLMITLGFFLASAGVFAAGAMINGGASVGRCAWEGICAAEELMTYLEGKT